jgi:hypothetical protein
MKDNEDKGTRKINKEKSESENYDYELFSNDKATINAKRRNKYSIFLLLIYRNM